MATEKIRTPLNRARVLKAAVAFADEHGIASLSMRNLGQELGVEAMSLYNHVRSKDDLLDGMVDTVLADIDQSPGGTDWKSCLRHRILSARSALITHPWASQVIESRKDPSPTMIGYFDGVVAIFRDGGFSMDLIHHAMHALGSRMLGFSQELFSEGGGAEEDPEAEAMTIQMLERYPNLSAMLQVISHDPEEPQVGAGCDDQTEFIFGLDLILDGLERLHAEAATSSPA